MKGEEDEFTACTIDYTVGECGRHPYSLVFYQSFVCWFIFSDLHLYARSLSAYTGRYLTDGESFGKLQFLT
jgi:hypothetical protein